MLHAMVTIIEFSALFSFFSKLEQKWKISNGMKRYWSRDLWLELTRNVFTECQTSSNIKEQRNARIMQFTNDVPVWHDANL